MLSIRLATWSNVSTANGRPHFTYSTNNARWAVGGGQLGMKQTHRTYLGKRFFMKNKLVQCLPLSGPRFLLAFFLGKV